jgi:signal transduction histidine kinase/CheY-like chemotaxis protein
MKSNQNLSNIFENSFLILKNKDMEKLYNSNKYSISKFMCYFFFSIFFNCVNLILYNNNILKDRKSIENNIFLMNFVLLGFKLVLLLIFLTIYAFFRMRNKIFSFQTRFLFFISIICSGDNILQTQIIRHFVKVHSGYSFSNEYIFPNMSWLLGITYALIYDNNCFIYSIGYLWSNILIVAFQIGQFWLATDKICFLILIFILQFIFNFLFFRIEKQNFFLNETLKNDLAKTINLINNLNSGIIIINKNFQFDYNSKIYNYINLEKRNPESLLNINNFLIKKFLFNGFEEFDSEIDENIANIFNIFKVLDRLEYDEEKEYNKFLNLLFEKMKFQNEFVYLGNKRISKNIDKNHNDIQLLVNDKEIASSSQNVLRVYIRLNPLSDTLEFILYDVSSIIELGEINAQDKYKNIFLNKFSHDFKNPLLNIISLIKEIRKGIKNKKISRLSNSSRSYQNVDSFSCLSNYDYLSDEEKNLLHIKNLCNYMTSLIGDFDFISHQPDSRSRAGNSTPVSNSSPNRTLITPSKMGSQNSCTYSSYLNKFKETQSKIIEENHFELKKLLKFCIEVFRSRIEINDKNININFVLDSDVPEFICTDNRRLKQVILNLLSNSYKFTNNGSITVKVTKEKKQICSTTNVLSTLNHPMQSNFKINENSLSQRNIKPSHLTLPTHKNPIFSNYDNFEPVTYDHGRNIQAELRFSVIDTGVGIKQDIISKLQGMDNFKLEKNSNNVHGIGLGIFITKKILKEIGSGFQITSEFGKGTTVGFSIPLKFTKKQSNGGGFNSLVPNNSNGMIPLTQNQSNSRKAENRHILKTLKNFNTKSGAFYKDIRSDSRSSYKTCKLPQFANSAIHSLSFLKNKKSRRKISQIPEEEDMNLVSEAHSMDYGIFEASQNGEKNNISFCSEMTKNIINSFQFDANKIYAENAIYKTLNMDSSKEIKRELTYPKKNEDSIFLNFPNIRKKCVSSFGLTIPQCFQDQSKLNILIVDDEKLIRSSHVSIVKKYFQNLNRAINILECTDGIECLYYIFKGNQQGVKFHYILTDETMQFMRGSMLVENIKSLITDNVLYNIQIYMITSYEISTISNQYSILADKIFTKPLSSFHVDQIFSEIKNV